MRRRSLQLAVGTAFADIVCFHSGHVEDVAEGLKAVGASKLPQFFGESPYINGDSSRMSDPSVITNVFRFRHKTRRLYTLQTTISR